MWRFARQRLPEVLVVLLGVLTLVFFTMRLSGDPTVLMVGPQGSEADIVRLRHALGFDRPLLVQYVDFVWHVLRGDFGQSLRFQQPAAALVLQTLPATVLLAVLGFLLSLAIAVPLGVVAATRRGTWLDLGSSVLALFGQSMPSFWLGLMLILAFAVRLHWFPTGGIGGPSHLVLPAVTMALYTMARTARLTRAGVLEVLRQDFIRTAKAKGLPQRVVIFKHALRGAALPVVTILGLEFGTLLGGAVVTETVFSYPGVGRLVVQAILTRDYPLVEAAVCYLALLFVLINLGLDLFYAWLDPRIRYA